MTVSLFRSRRVHRICHVENFPMSTDDVTCTDDVMGSDDVSTIAVTSWAQIVVTDNQAQN